MTDILMIDGNHRSKSIARIISSSAAFGIADTHVFASFMQKFWNLVTANEYTRLAAFGLIWTLLNVILVDTGFYLSYNEQPFHIVRLFAGIL
jgi:hypothetical protein